MRTQNSSSLRAGGHRLHESVCVWIKPGCGLLPSLFDSSAFSGNLGLFILSTLCKEPFAVEQEHPVLR